MIGTFSALFQAALTANMLDNLRHRVKIVLGETNLEGVGEDWTLAIPVRNEEKNLKELLPLLIDQNYRPKEILFLNDQSQDSTSEVLKEASLRYPWIRVLEGTALGAEWRGKVWALHQLLKEVKTPYVVFMDADVRPESAQSFGSFWSYAQKVGFTKNAKSGFLSGFPRSEGSYSSRLLVDQVPVHLHYFLPFFRRFYPLSGAVAGCGQLMLLNVDEFKALGGFARLRHSTHDGLKLARLYQGSSKNVFTLDLAEVFSVKMYEDFVEAFKGFSRNSYEADTSLPVAIGMSTALFWGFVVPYVFWPFLILNPVWAASFMYYLYGQKKLAHEMKWPTSSLLSMPLKGAASAGVHLWGAYRALRQVETVWRGRTLK